MAKKKINPQNSKELIEALQKGDLDRRCAISREIINTRQIISENPEVSIKAILSNSISINCQIQDKILKEMQNKKVIGADGRVDKLITQDLLNVQRSLLSHCGLLAQLEGILYNQKNKQNKDREAKQKRGRLISDIILECNSNDNIFDVNNNNDIQDNNNNADID